MTLAVGETSQTRINAEIRRTEQRVGVLETDLTALSGKFVEGSGVLTYGGTPAGLIPVEQFFRLNADLGGANVATPQSVFGVGCTLAASTVYAFEIVCSFGKTAGATSHTLSFGFGGTAALNHIGYVSTINVGAAVPGAASTAFINRISTATATALTNAMAAASNSVRLRLAGSVSVNTAGTFIPQYTLSAAPGGAYSTEQGSFMRIYPIGAAGSNTSIGTWA